MLRGLTAESGRRFRRPSGLTQETKGFSDPEKLWRGVWGYLPVNVVQAIAGLGAIVVFTRLLSPADYGAYALGFSISSLVHTCLFTWLEAAVARFHAAEAPGPDRSALFAVVRRTFAALTLSVPLVTLAVLAFAPVSDAVRWAVAAGVLSVVFRSGLKLVQERRRAAGEVRGFAVYDMAQTAGAFALGAAGAAAGLGGAAPLLGAGLASALCLAWALTEEARRPREAPRFDRARLARYAAYGLPLSLSLVLALVLATTDRFVLAAFTDEATVGAYHAGYSLSNRTLDVLFVWLGMAGGPAAVAAFERGGETALRRTAAEQARLMALLALPAAAGLALVARPLAELMVGPALRDGAARVTPWIALGGLLGGATTYYLHTAFTLGRRTGRLLAAMAMPAGANLVLNLLLVPRFGLEGAVGATAASFGLGLVASAALGRSVVRLPLPWATIGRCALAAAVMTAVVLRLPSWGGALELGLKAGVGALTYAAAALALDAAGVRGRAAELLAARRTRPA